MARAGERDGAPGAEQRRGEFHLVLGEKIHTCGPGRDVKNGGRLVHGESIHELAAPSPVLAEREDLGQGVITLGQPAEKLDGHGVVAQRVSAYGGRANQANWRLVGDSSTR